MLTRGYILFDSCGKSGGVGQINYLRRSLYIVIPLSRAIGSGLMIRIVGVATTRTITRTITITVVIMFPFSIVVVVIMSPFSIVVVVTSGSTRTVPLSIGFISRRSNRGSSHSIRLRNRNRLWNRLPRVYVGSPFPMFSVYGMGGMFSRIRIGLKPSLCMRMHLGSRRRRANRRRSSLGESVNNVPRGTQKT